MPASPGRRRAGRWTLGLGAVALTLVGLLLVRRHTIDTRWSEAVASADALQARLEAHAPPRLRATSNQAATGNAWPHYEAAIAALETDPPDEAAALAALRRAGDAATARFPVPWREGFAGATLGR